MLCSNALLYLKGISCIRHKTKKHLIEVKFLLLLNHGKVY